eukprot:CAMPEP_0181201704 /NCGR_PEP_ID=MMETSP1096-20121128/18447_1 /TAXON_ID=156174 ORGANISM="Chrysochromulina ericina, Strain CCMP281" /NCGR_SAMPLE_ID=MMETSP1096 /ASSEMBLY_ACC=CAM_ASM_000453 /LENGTH=55 /DNA_ID=CAMNT_0023292161 /DNA_START=421 /DNA_END=585 /DNA_ORIENTATION=+
MGCGRAARHAGDPPGGSVDGSVISGQFLFDLLTVLLTLRHKDHVAPKLGHHGAKH